MLLKTYGMSAEKFIFYAPEKVFLNLEPFELPSIRGVQSCLLQVP